MAVTFKDHTYTGTRRIGSARPTALLFTAGVGAIVELPHMTVIVRGLDAWDTTMSTEVNEPRLLAAVQQRLRSPGVKKLVRPPHIPENPDDPFGGWSRIGVPVTPFPRWLRCTKCDLLGPMDSDQFKLDVKPYNVDQSRFLHVNCQRSSKGPLAVAARFVLACGQGHLDDFPYAYFVHKGTPCTKPRYEMHDYGRGLGPLVEVRCTSCQARRLMVEAFGRPKAPQQLPGCRGRNPQLGTVDPKPCTNTPCAMVLGASNLWFSQVLTSLYLPHAGGDLHTLVQAHWSTFDDMDLNDGTLKFALKHMSELSDLREYTLEAVKNAIIAIRNPADDPAGDIDLKKPEWDAFTKATGHLAPGDSDFRLKTVPVPAIAPAIGLTDVVLVERLREAKALVGFTRISTAEPDDPHSDIQPGKLAHQTPTWVPAVDARGEGIFLRFDENHMTAWETAAQTNGTVNALHEAHREHSRRLGRTGSDVEKGWIGDRGVPLHTFAHLLIREIALDCGYNAQSLSERIYVGTQADPHAGILIYTTAADSEGTLGGLVYLGNPAVLDRLIRAALDSATRCSGDPLCSEHAPNAELIQLHGAACHLCTFAAETTCEFNNRYLDRATVVTTGPNPTPLEMP